jgi:tRNA U34 2-thiouridine synthase MnmA/TrmU
MKLMREKNESKQSPARALVLFSGGLDSILAVKILEEQGIEVTVLTFVSYFFDAWQAEKSALENKLKLKIVDFSDAHFEMIKKPKYGRGAGMNPCIDCHLLMLEQAKKIAKKENFDVIATGEVLGQRPMSQNSRALDLIEKKAGLVGKILRPLSALALLETEMEKSGIVDREKMQGISGRSRKDQMELAKKCGVKAYPSPAGGCILTDGEYSKKLRELTDKIKTIKKSDIDLLRFGRHFWVGKTRIILGRNHEENLKLKKLAGSGDVLIEPKDIPGPTALVRGKRNKAVLDFANKMLLKYTKNAGDDLQVKITEV